MTDSKRCLDVWSAASIVAASMIGVGVYTTSGYSLAAANSPWTVVVAWAIGGVIAVCGAIGYGALAREFTQSGGEYLLLSKTLHPAAGLMVGWVSLLAGFTGPIALAALTLEVYAKPWTQSIVGRLFAGELPAGTVAIAAIILAAGLHAVSVRPSARVQDLVVLAKLLMLGMIVLLAAMVPVGDWNGTQTNSDTPDFSIASFATSLLYISFSYAGFNAAIYIAGEVRDAARNVPRAMVLATLMVAVLYVLLNAAFVLIPDRSAVAGQQEIASIAAGAIGGDWMVGMTRSIIVVSLLTSVSALMMTGPRVYSRMADDGFLPAWLRFRGTSPVVPIAFQATLAIVAVCVGSIQTLLSYLGFTLALSSALTVAMVLLRPATTASKIAAAIFLAATIATATIAAWNEPWQAIAAAITLSIGWIVYGLMKKREPVVMT